MTESKETKPMKKFSVKEMVRRIRFALETIAANPDRQMRADVLKTLARKLVRTEGKSL